MPDTLHDRWTNLVEAIRKEWRNHGRDPLLVEADETALKVSLPLDGTGTKHSAWYDADTVMGGDPAVIAATLYRNYGEAAKDEGPGST